MRGRLAGRRCPDVKPGTLGTLGALCDLVECEVAAPEEHGPGSAGPRQRLWSAGGRRLFCAASPGPIGCWLGEGVRQHPWRELRPRGEVRLVLEARGGGAWSWARGTTGLTILGPVRGPQRRERERIGGSTCHLDLELSSLSAEEDQDCSPVERTAREGHTRSRGERGHEAAQGLSLAGGFMSLRD
ncbi:hypothetical protein NDU88_004131 [Pleurodeles waltl]|uniref:Uncharacterized protein n=1 Tax=Pleurodeles waltl TaxID=8319 RepID=A0AAV7T8G1_PLEWA|nr:hypothetical protein NDU88_004131 [Pleurodeles waltl]